jgi:hypothetical protein
MKKVTILSLAIFFSIQMMAQIQHESKSIPLKPSINLSGQFTKDDVNVFLWQDFDEGLMPPAGWTILSGTTPQTWQPGTADIYPPYSGDYFAICRFDDTYIPEGQDEKLYSPVIDLSGLDDAQLSFWFLFSRYWGITPYDNYDLQVLLSTDGGTTFGDTIWTELSTDTAGWSSWQWVRAEIDMTPYVNETTVQLCFRYVGYDGADAAIENVEISFITGMNERIVNTLKLYPNPARELFFVEGIGNRTVTVYDMKGNLILTKTLQSGEHSIPVSGLSAGQYSVVTLQHETLQKNSATLILY